MCKTLVLYHSGPLIYVYLHKQMRCSINWEGVRGERERREGESRVEGGKKAE